MKQGRSLEELGMELERQRRERKDLVADTRALFFHTGKEGSILSVFGKNQKEEFAVSGLAHRQIAARLEIPFRYYQKMQGDYPELLDDNINAWLQKRHEKRMLRILDGKVRAFLSDRYRRLDNLELCAAVLPVIRDMDGAEIKSCEITDCRMYIKVVSRTLQAEVRPGDIVRAGFVISNSEVGLGSLRVEPLVYRLVCTNGLIAEDFGKKKYHVGRQISCEDNAYELYSDKTLEQDDKAFFMKAGDIVRAAADENKFNLIVGRMKEAAGTPTGDNPVETVKELADRFLLNDEEQTEILKQFFAEGDRSRYGLVNAITAAGKNAENYERATSLERIGGNLLAFPQSRKGRKDISLEEAMAE